MNFPKISICLLLWSLSSAHAMQTVDYHATPEYPKLLTIKTSYFYLGYVQKILFTEKGWKFYKIFSDKMKSNDDKIRKLPYNVQRIISNRSTDAPIHNGEITEEFIDMLHKKHFFRNDTQNISMRDYCASITLIIPDKFQTGLCIIEKY